MQIKSYLCALFAIVAMMLPAAAIGDAPVASKLITPVSLYERFLFSPFGQRKAKFGNRLHVGDDIARPADTRVDAIATGIVRYVGRRNVIQETCRDWGDALILEHRLPDGRRFNSMYAHLTETPALKLGDVVHVGDQIGTIGRYEKDGEPCWIDHLHFAIFIGNFEDSPGRHPLWITGYLRA